MTSRPGIREGEREPLDRAHLLDHLQRFGTNPVSFLAMYDAPWELHDGQAVDGSVCYVESNRTAIAWGDPLCAPEDAPTLVAEFTGAMRARGLRTCWLAVSEDAARLAMGSGHAVLKIGEDPVFDLRTWRQPRGDPGKKLRWCVNHARRAGVTVSEYDPRRARDHSVEAEIADARRTWEASLGRRPVRSFLRSAPLEEIERKRVFLARRGGRLEAVLSCSPVYGRNGWYLEDMIRLPGAVNGSTELLVVEALSRLSEDGAAFASLGIAPLRGSDRQIDRRARWLARALKLAFERFDSRYHFASLSRFKTKFRPTAWEDRFVAFNPPRPSVGLVRGVISALDPEPAPAEQPSQVATWRRALVVVQAVVLALASGVVLAGGHVTDRVGEPAGLLAPVGLAGIVIAGLLFFFAAGLSKLEGMLVRLAAVGLEVAILWANVIRLHDRRGVPVAILGLAVATTAVVLLVRRPDGAGVPDELD